MDAVCELERAVGLRSACSALGVPRASFYRCRRTRKKCSRSKPRPTPARALGDRERRAVLNALHTEFVDRSPYEVHAALLERGVYLCSVRTMYRILAASGETRERRDQLRHPAYAKPELLATAANQVWSWDITKLRGARKWTYYYLYVLLDIYSRYVVGWMLAHRESGELASELVRRTVEAQQIKPRQLIVHADRGPAPASKTLAELYIDLGVERSHNRPHVSNDNPYSESQFKTLKYSPDYPDRFGGFEDALSYCRRFFPWYNDEHRHSGIAYLTPADVHHGRAVEVLRRRQSALDMAFEFHPERFVNGRPKVPALPRKVWINKPEPKNRKEISLH